MISIYGCAFQSSLVNHLTHLLRSWQTSLKSLHTSDLNAVSTVAKLKNPFVSPWTQALCPTVRLQRDECSSPCCLTSACTLWLVSPLLSWAPLHFFFLLWQLQVFAKHTLCRPQLLLASGSTCVHCVLPVVDLLTCARGLQRWKEAMCCRWTDRAQKKLSTSLFGLFGNAPPPIYFVWHPRGASSSSV